MAWIKIQTSMQVRCYHQ